MNRIRIRTLAAFAAAMLMLASCASEGSSGGSSSDASQAESSTAQTGSQPDNDSSVTPASNVKSEKGYGGYYKYTLSGKKEDTLVTTDFSYIESDKYFLLMEKDLKIPGDLTANLDKIIDQLEKSTGLRYDPDTYDYSRRTDICSSLYGFNPWNGLDFGHKIPIYLVVDRKDEHLISGADDTNALICAYELFSDDVWNSVPSYRDNDFRRPDYISYDVFAHELTHTITSRYVNMSKTLTEGSATYYSWKTMKALADVSEDMKKAFDYLDSDEVQLSVTVTAENAESIFVDDFSDLDTEDRGDEYTFGNYLWKYLDETFGTEKTAELFTRFRENEIIGKTLDYTVNNKNTAEYAKVIKEQFGDDVFEKFGAQYPN